MRIAKRALAAALGLLGLILVSALFTRPAMPQCAMMGSSSHDHDAAQDPGEKKSTSEKKQRASVEQLLSDKQGRRVLAETILADREFTQDLIARLLNSPEWRPVVTQELKQPSPTRKPAGDSGATQSTTYVCPMHPDVTSSKPGSCPRCGMALVPATPKS